MARLFGGEFPDCNRIIPKDLKTRITLQAADFLRAARAAQAFARANLAERAETIRPNRSARAAEPTGDARCNVVVWSTETARTGKRARTSERLIHAPNILSAHV
jgi:hypothetical protein